MRSANAYDSRRRTNERSRFKPTVKHLFHSSQHSFPFLRRNGNMINLVSMDVQECTAARESIKFLDRAHTNNLRIHSPVSPAFSDTMLTEVMSTPLRNPHSPIAATAFPSNGFEKCSSLEHSLATPGIDALRPKQVPCNDLDTQPLLMRRVLDGDVPVCSFVVCNELIRCILNFHEPNWNHSIDERRTRSRTGIGSSISWQIKRRRDRNRLTSSRKDRNG